MELWLSCIGSVLFLLPKKKKKKKKGGGEKRLGGEELSIYACHDCYAASWSASAVSSATSLPSSSCRSRWTEYSECFRQVFCVALVTTSRNLWLIWPLCTVDLSLYLILFPERNSLYILGFLESLFSLFSPIAGEGFTCLDHSKLSKKNYILAFGSYFPLHLAFGGSFPPHFSFWELFSFTFQLLGALFFYLLAFGSSFPFHFSFWWLFSFTF